MTARRTICPPAERPKTLDAQPMGSTFYALRTSLGDWTSGPSSEWAVDSGCLRVGAKKTTTQSTAGIPGQTARDGR